MSVTLNILFMFFLASQTYPTFLGAKNAGNPSNSFLLVLIPVFMQLAFFWLGYLIGNMFLYLMEDFSTIVVFVGLFILGIRFAVDAFTVRKGKRTFSAKNILQIALAAVAQSTNTFLLGIIFCFFTINLFQTLALLGLASLLFSLAGTLSKVSKRNLAFASFLFLFGGIFIISSSIYLAFFNL